MQFPNTLFVLRVADDANLLDLAFAPTSFVNRDDQLAAAQAHSNARQAQDRFSTFSVRTFSDLPRSVQRRVRQLNSANQLFNPAFPNPSTF